MAKTEKGHKNGELIAKILLQVGLQLKYSFKLRL